MDYWEKMDTKTKVLFIIMNLLAPPFSTIVGAVVWGWYGAIGSLVIFYLSYRLWKYVGKIEGSLRFNPKVRW